MAFRGLKKHSLLKTDWRLCTPNFMEMIMQKDANKNSRWHLKNNSKRQAPESWWVGWKTICLPWPGEFDVLAGAKWRFSVSEDVWFLWVGPPWGLHCHLVRMDCGHYRRSGRLWTHCGGLGWIASDISWYAFFSKNTWKNSIYYKVGPYDPVISGVIYKPYKWPKIHGFAWGEKTPYL